MADETPATPTTPFQPGSPEYLAALAQAGVPSGPIQQADQTQIPASTQLTPPQQGDPYAGMHPAVKAELQQRAAQAQQAQQPPRMGGKPLLLDYIQQMIHPQAASPLSRPESRGDMTLNFMGQFLANLAQGLAAAGHGPGANLRGAAGAIQAPYQRELQQYQLGQQQQAQQAAVGAEQARTQQTEAQTRLLGQSIPLTLPNGQQIYIPANQIGQYLKGGAAAQIGAQAKMSVEQMKAALAMGQVSKVMPVDTPNGKVMRAFNKYGKPLGDIDGAIPPTSYLPKESSTIEYKQLDDGSIVALPKTTITQPVTGGKGASTRGAVPVGGPVTVKDAQGNPILGKGAVTSTTRTMVETAPKVLDLVDRVKAQINDLEKSGDLGPGMSRWNEFWSGKVGEDNPRFRAMMTNTTLLSTLLMRMHMGARGSTQIMQHFDQMIGAGHQSAANMKAALDQLEIYANDVKGAAPLPANYGKSNQGPISKVDALVGKYGGRTNP